MYDSRIDTFEHIRHVQTFLTLVIYELLDRSSEHDLSKLSDPEKEVYDLITPKLKELTYGTDEYFAQLKKMNIALQHHYKNNSHHPEHYMDGIKGMNLLDLIEMICDWKAATLRHPDGDIKRSIEINQKRFGYSDELKQIFLNTIDMF